jgi:hypothetical protein
MIRCPNLSDEKTRDEFNSILERLGGLRMSADDIRPRQSYLARLNDAQERAYFQAHYLWHAHDDPADIKTFLNVLHEARTALSSEPAFSVSQPTAKHRLGPKPRASKNIEHVQTVLTDLVRAHLGKHVEITFPNTILLPKSAEQAWGDFAATHATGVYLPAAQLIKIALDQSIPTMVRTAFHESYHAIEHLLLTDHEFAVMERAEPALRRIVQKYFNASQDSVDTIAPHEIRAIAYEIYGYERLKGSKRPRFPQAVHVIFETLSRLFERIRNALARLGFHSYRDVFSDIISGKMAERPSTPSAPRWANDSGNKAAAFNVQRPPSMPVPTPNLDRRIRDAIERVFGAGLGAKLTEGLQDLSHPVRLLQDELERRRAAAFDDPKNFYVRKRLYPHRLAAWITGFNQQYLDPIADLLKKHKISLQEAGDFLYAEHARERNARIAQINPAIGNAGSGMSDEDAEQILAAAMNGPKAAAFRELSQRVQDAFSLILNTMEKAGLEKPDIIAAWRAQYLKYRSLRGWEVEPEDVKTDYRGSGVGFQVRGKEVHEAFGRRSKADNPLINLFDQAYRTFDRAERNRYLQSLFRALQELGPNAADIAALDRGKPQRQIDPKTGFVRIVETSNEYMNPKAVYLKFDGNPHFIVFKKQELADAIKRMNPESIGIFHSYLVLQNKLKALWTHYSPDFLFRHFVFRYPIEGTLNSFELQESGDHKVSRYIKEAFPFLGDASRAIFASNKGVRLTTGNLAQMQNYWDEMRKAGGAQMFRNMRDIELMREHLATVLQDLSNRPIANARARWRHAVEAMDTVTNALDNSLRLAAFAAARRTGKSVQQAAFIATEATVDFRLKGRWNNILGVLFPFSNVAIQTGARMSKAVYRSRKMRQVFGYVTLAGFLLGAFNYLIAGNDRDGIPFFDKLPQWDRSLNMIVLNPFVTDAKGRPQPIKIPMPYNWAFPLVLGYVFAGSLWSTLGLRKLMTMLAHSALETFTPLGSEHNIAAVAMPEMARPLVHVYTNEDWAGRSIHRDPRYQTRANAASAKKNTGAGWSALAEGINTATGGSRSKSGLLDLYPEDYRELLDQFVGTQLRLGENVLQTVTAIGAGQLPESTHVPLARVIYGTNYDAADRARHYEQLEKRRRPWTR